MSRFARPKADSPEAKYLYCIIKCERERSFNGVQAVGGRGDQVQTVVFRDLAAVVSDSLDTQYDSTRANMMAHETVIERVMQEFTVLPIRFGTVTRKGIGSSVKDIQHKLLESRYQELQDLHDKLDNRVELGLRALWREEGAIFEEIVAKNKEVRGLRDSITGRPPEATHFERMRLGEMVKAALDRKRAREAEQILSPLRPLVERIRQNKILMDRMILNAALLVRKDREAGCDQAVKKLDEEFGDRMVLKYSGPNPPFNFCEIVVSWDEE